MYMYMGHACVVATGWLLIDNNIIIVHEMGLRPEGLSQGQTPRAESTLQSHWLVLQQLMRSLHPYKRKLAFGEQLHDSSRW